MVAFDGAVTEFASDLGADNDKLTVKRLALSKGMTMSDSSGNNTFSNVDAGGAIACILGGGDDTVSLAGFLIGAKAVTAAARRRSEYLRCRCESHRTRRPHGDRRHRY